MSATETKTRFVTALWLTLVFIALTGLAAYFCIGRWLLFCFGLVMSMGISVEIGNMCVPMDAPQRRLLRTLYSFLCFVPSLSIVVLGLARYSCEIMGISLPTLVGGLLLGFALSSLGGLATAVFLGRSSLESGKARAFELMFASLLGFGAACLVSFALIPPGILPLIWLVLVVCVNDIAAYFFGRSLQGPKLAEAFSPKKTFSGALFGLAIGALVGSLTFSLLTVGASWVWGLSFSALVVIAAQIGDLSKSLLKRVNDVKDSGSILPGHGGVLDRLDGMLAAAPLVIAFLVLS